MKIHFTNYCGYLKKKKLNISKIYQTRQMHSESADLHQALPFPFTVKSFWILTKNLDHHQILIDWSLYHSQAILKISAKSVHNF